MIIKEQSLITTPCLSCDHMLRFWQIPQLGQKVTCPPELTPEQQNRLFIPFAQLIQSRVRGHSLGLSIVYRIINKKFVLVSLAFFLTTVRTKFVLSCTD